MIIQVYHEKYGLSIILKERGDTVTDEQKLKAYEAALEMSIREEKKLSNIDYITPRYYHRLWCLREVITILRGEEENYD